LDDSLSQKREISNNSLYEKGIITVVAGALPPDANLPLADTPQRNVIDFH